MRRVRYGVVMSVDGFIAGPKGEADWITHDPDFDFGALFRQFDTILAGRRTFDTMVTAERTTIPGMKTIVFSRTLKQEDYPGVTLVKSGHREMLTELKGKAGKDIWLFGGGSLFASLAADGLVDTLEVRVAPVLLGAGVPLMASVPKNISLKLKAHSGNEAGVVSLEYLIG
jgi:dihydrofolate reductase